jgi:nicotinamide mononucleotide adenylyltransferase
MLSECTKVIIAVGSAQEYGTEKNPLTFEFRKTLIYDAYYKCTDKMIENIFADYNGNILICEYDGN